MTPEEAAELIRLAKELGQAQARVKQLEGALAATSEALLHLIAQWDAGGSRASLQATALAAASEIRGLLKGG